jgi:hypothetical protein
MLTQAMASYWTKIDASENNDMIAVSSLYTSLPQVLQRRVPKIPSLRRTASRYGKSTSLHRRDPSDVSCASTLSITPPPSYRTSRRTSVYQTDEEDAEAYSSLASSPSSAGSKTLALEVEVESGVRWKYAKQGMSLLGHAAAEGSVRSQDGAFTRKLYLDGVEYILRGLPNNLSLEETASLRCAVPTAIVPASIDDKALVHPSHHAASSSATAPPQNFSLLRRATANLIFYLFLLASFILPYIQFLLQQAYRYDRQHKVSDRLIAQGVATANEVGRQTVTLANSVCALSDGQVGIAAKEMGMWWMQGVSSGVYDGVGEGMQVLGLRADGKSASNDGRRRLDSE